MAFTPDFDVAVEQPGDIRFAAEAIRLMGQQTSMALRPNVRPLEDVVNSGTGLLTVTSAAKLAQLGLKPPLTPDSGTLVTVDDTPVTEVDISGPLGVLQAFTHNERMVLAVSTSGDEQLIAQTFGYIDSLEGRWAALTGDVIATGLTGTVDLTIRAGGYLAPHAPPSVGWQWWTWLTIGIGVFAAFAVIITLVIRRRRAAG
jgi:hypothetical protein